MSDTYPHDELISSPQGDYDALRYVASETPCPYLPGLMTRNEAYFVEQLDGEMYERLLAKGYRRSGRIIYRPRCRGCQECRAVRIPVEQFQPSRSMRRNWRLNNDVEVTIGEPEQTEDKFEIFGRYLDHQHDDTMSRTFESFGEFLYDSPMDTCEVCYKLDGRIIGVSLVDRWSSGLSSVYMYFDPEFASRGLGTYSVLWEVDFARRNHIHYYYLGYWIAQSPKMAYKSRFRPNEVLVGADRWVALRE